MTRHQANGYLAAIVTTVAEIEAEEDSPVPLGPIYVGLMGRISYEEWQKLTDVLSHGGLAVLTTETIALTDEGRKCAARCNEWVV